MLVFIKPVILTVLQDLTFLSKYNKNNKKILKYSFEYKFEHYMKIVRPHCIKN